ncbi:MAG: D-ribose-binding periplasmic protein precursor [Pseudomonadota bacterium]
MIQKRLFSQLALAVVAAAVLTACGKKEEAAPAAAAPAAPAAKEVTVAYITNGNTNEGWTLINGGAKAAGAAPGVKFIELAAEKGELSKQLAIVEDMITRKVNAIAIAPVDSKGIAPAISKALAAGIAVVAVDTGIDGAEITSYVATDNVPAAKSQGDWAADQVGDTDTVIYVTGDQGQSTGRERKEGFLAGLKAKKPNVKVVEVPTTWDQTMAQNGVEAALKANPKAKVIACAWDGGALGAKAALLAAGKKPGDVKIAGFDGSPGGLDMMKEGWQQANSAQMLAKIGKVGVETAIAAANGGKVEKRIDTGSFLVLPANVDQFAKDSGVGQFMKVK